MSATLLLSPARSSRSCTAGQLTDGLAGTGGWIHVGPLVGVEALTWIHVGPLVGVVGGLSDGLPCQWTDGNVPVRVLLIAEGTSHLVQKAIFHSSCLLQPIRIHTVIRLNGDFLPLKSAVCLLLFSALLGGRNKAKEL